MTQSSLRLFEGRLPGSRACCNSPGCPACPPPISSTPALVTARISPVMPAKANPKQNPSTASPARPPAPRRFLWNHSLLPLPVRCLRESSFICKHSGASRRPRRRQSPQPHHCRGPYLLPPIVMLPPFLWFPPPMPTDPSPPMAVISPPLIWILPSFSKNSSPPLPPPLPLPMPVPFWPPIAVRKPLSPSVMVTLNLQARGPFAARQAVFPGKLHTGAPLNIHGRGILRRDIHVAQHNLKKRLTL